MAHHFLHLLQHSKPSKHSKSALNHFAAGGRGGAGSWVAEAGARRFLPTTIRTQVKTTFRAQGKRCFVHKKNDDSYTRKTIGMLRRWTTPSVHVYETSYLCTKQRGYETTGVLNDTNPSEACEGRWVWGPGMPYCDM